MSGSKPTPSGKRGPRRRTAASVRSSRSAAQLRKPLAGTRQRGGVSHRHLGGTTRCQDRRKFWVAGEQARGRVPVGGWICQGGNGGGSRTVTKVGRTQGLQPITTATENRRAATRRRSDRNRSNHRKRRGARPHARHAPRVTCWLFSLRRRVAARVMAFGERLRLLSWWPCHSGNVLTQGRSARRVRPKDQALSVTACVRPRRPPRLRVKSAMDAANLAKQGKSNSPNHGRPRRPALVFFAFFAIPALGMPTCPTLRSRERPNPAYHPVASRCQAAV